MASALDDLVIVFIGDSRWRRSGAPRPPTGGEHALISRRSPRYCKQIFARGIRTYTAVKLKKLKFSDPSAFFFDKCKYSTLSPGCESQPSRFCPSMSGY